MLLGIFREKVLICSRNIFEIGSRSFQLLKVNYYTHTHTHTHTYIYIYTYEYTYVHAYVYVYIYIYTYIRT